MKLYKVTGEAPDNSGVESNQTDIKDDAENIMRNLIRDGWVNVKFYQLMHGNYSLIVWENMR